MWKYYAVLSAFFAALTAILAKCGVSGINSNLATAIRTAVILIITWGIVLVTGGLSQMKELSRRNLMFLVLSGIATGLSWLFYFKALQLGDVSKIAPVDKLSVAFAVVLGFLFLHETVSFHVLIGTALIISGSLVILAGGK